MRRALIVGIDHYETITPLSGCVNDANAVKGVLERNADGSVNFGCRLLVGDSAQNIVTRTKLKEAIRELFFGHGEVALLYFAGHGYIESTGGYLCAADCHTGDDGLSLHEIMTLATSSRISNRVVILDSCFSGIAGVHPTHESLSELVDGITILTASTAEQYASEINGSGAFTTLFVDALRGAGANLVGDVTPGSAYAHVDQSLGPWSQRPVFKTNVRSFISLRKATPPINLKDLRRISEFFPQPGFEFQLDPSYEPERTGAEEATVPAPDPEKNSVFAVLQKYNRVNLVVPIGAPHMWHAAMQNRSCRLTVLGEHYRRLAEDGIL
ncbi:MAG: caspase family protein [Gammaproteobacteria bacterium]|nr:caspase family protein [Gammaproteobacteria bacterium]